MKYICYLIFTICILLSVCTGCSQADEIEIVEAQESATVETLDFVVATVDGQEILYSQVAEQMITMETMYSGMVGQLTDEEIAEKLSEAAMSVVNTLIENQILSMKIDEMGIVLTEEELAGADQAWADLMAQMELSVLSTSPDLTGDDLDAAVILALEMTGLSQNVVESNYISALEISKLQELVAEQVAQPTEEQVQAAYDALLEAQKASYDEDLTQFESDMLASKVVVYYPSDYRVLREIELRFDDDMVDIIGQLALYDTADDDTYEEILESEYARLMDTDVIMVQQALENGQSVAQVLEGDYSIYKERTNYISQDTTRFSEQYYAIAMGIETMGLAGAEAMVQDYGYKLICWEDQLVQQEIPLDAVYDAIYENLATQNQSEAWTNAKEQWRNEATITIDEESILYVA